MSQRIAVFAPIPTYQWGLITTFKHAGFQCDAIDDLDGWVRLRAHRAIVLTLELPADIDQLVRVQENECAAAVVAVLHRPGPATFRVALAAGASTAVAWDAPPETMVSALRAALENYSLIPVDVAQAIARSQGAIGDHLLSDTELGWLRMLAGGTTVSELSALVGYSEREMFRRLRSVYRRVGARSRIDALVWVARAGLLEAS